MNFLPRSQSRFLIVSLFLGAVLVPHSGRAATFNIANGNVVALVAAINTANSNGQDDTINLALNGTYGLPSVNNNTLGANGLPVITSDGGHALFINGNNSLIARSTAGGTPDFRIFQVASSAKVTMSRVQIRNGRVVGTSPGGDNSGGGVLNFGTLTLQNSLISNNVAVSSGVTQSEGAGIYTAGGSITLTNCTVSANAASGTTDAFGGEGGGIFINNARLTLVSSTVSGNSATKNNPATGAGGNGGGLVVLFGPTTIRNTTIAANTATASGGGIISFGSGSDGLAIVDSTFNGNMALNGGGGGIFNDGASLKLTNCTLSGNAVPISGGGVYNQNTSLQLLNTIIAGNIATTPPAVASDVYSVTHPVASLGHNLIGITDPSANSGWVASDIRGSNASPRNPLLNPLANNGGPTQTMSLQAASPALNAGDNAVLLAPNNINSDQRRFARKFGAAVDIGAFEAGGVSVAAGDINGDGATDYVLLNATSRATAVWNLQANAFQASQFGPTLPSGWTLACVADFNADGERDYVIANSTTRQTAIWYLRNTTLDGSAFGPTLPPGWKLVAAADFNQDGSPDYVLFNQGTRQSSIWYLNGAILNNGVYGPTLPPNWLLADALDFTNDAKPDFLLINSSTRQTALWALNGTSFVNGAVGPTLPAGWTLQGAANFIGNGSPDLVLLQTATRKTALWSFNGAAVTGSAFGPTLPSGYTLAFP